MDKEQIKIEMCKQHFEWANSKEEAMVMDTQKSVYFPGKDGIYVYSKMNVGGNTFELIEKAPKCTIFGTVEQGFTGASISKKIPASLLKEIIGTFSYICDKSGNECAAQIYRNRTTEEYFIYYPEQEISKAFVTYKDDPQVVTLRADNELICELHSHDTMSAFWSGTDDNNETEACFYSVIGNLDKGELTYKCRIKVGEFSKDLRWSDLFDVTEEEEKEIMQRANRGEGNREEIEKKAKERPIVSTSLYSWRNDDWWDKYYQRYQGYQGYQGSENSTLNVASDPVDSASTPESNSKTDPYFGNYANFDVDESNDSGSLESAPLSIDTLHVSTQNYIYDLALDAITKEVSFNSVYISGINPGRVYDETLLSANENLDNGFGLGVFTSGSKEEVKMYCTNLDARIKARILDQYFMQIANKYITEDSCGSGLESIKSTNDFRDLVEHQMESSIVGTVFDLRVVWETMSQYEKASLANALKMSIVDLGGVVYSRETTNYYMLYLMYALGMASSPIKNRYVKLVRGILDNFDYMLIEEEYEEELWCSSNFDKLIEYMDAYLDDLGDVRVAPEFISVIQDVEVAIAEAASEASIEMDPDLDPDLDPNLDQNVSTQNVSTQIEKEAV